MSGRARLTVCAAAASLLAATALLPLTDKMTWFFKAVFVVCAIGGVGMVARRIPLARPLTVLAQTAVTVVLLTMLFASEKALGGMIPGPAATEEFRQLFQEGGDDVSRYSIPAPVTEGIELMLLSGIAGVALLVDAVAVTFRSAAPAGLPLLALYSVAAGLNQGGSWLTFLLAGAGYLLLLLAEGRDRLAQWGRMFGGGRSVGAPGGADPGDDRPQAPVRTGRRIGAVALGLALVVPAALPSLDGGLLDGKTTGPGQGSGGGTVTAINPVVRLQQSLNQPENREIFRYRAADGAQNQALYMRFVALDRFDGTSWQPSRRSIEDIPDPLPTPQGYSNSQVDSAPVTLNVRADDDFRQQWLPMPYPAYQVRIGGDWRYEPEGRSVVGDGGTTTGGAEYQVTSLIMAPTARQLANAPAPDPSLSEEYTEVPDSLPDEVREQAQEITRGAANDYERALALQDYFTTNFVYDTETDLDASDPEAILKFLRDKQGFCVHFSFAMAAMARTLDIPARVAVGFVPGTAQSDGSLSVGLQDAHAWPELYFEGAGWTRFEPTPTRGSLPDYTMEDTPSGGGDPSGELPERGSTATPVPSPSASEDECPASLRRVDGCADDEAAGGAAAGPSDGGPPAAGIAAGALGVLLLLLLPSMPAMWRVRERGRRLRPGAGPLAAWRELTDSAWDFGLPPDESQTPRTTAAALIGFGSLDGAAAQSALRVAGAVEQMLFAPRPRQIDGLAEDVRKVRAAMGRTAGPRARLTAALAPRSSVRLLWAVSARWAAVTARWRGAVRRAGAALRPSRQP